MARGGSVLDDVLDGPHGLDTVRELHSRGDLIASTRPGVVTIEPVWGDLERTYAELLDAIEPAPHR